MSNAYTYFSSIICIGRFFLTSALLFFILQRNMFVSFRCQESRCSDKAIGGRNLFDSLDGYWLSWSIQLCFCLSSRELRDTVGIAMDHDVFLQMLACLWLCTRLLPRCNYNLGSRNFDVVRVDALRLCIWNAVVRLPDDVWVWRATVEWYWQGKTKGLLENPVPVPLCPPQIPHGLTRVQTRTSAMRSRRITAWPITSMLNKLGIIIGMQVFHHKFVVSCL
jgi:hypothetical protein